jgi:prophage regulatory protein
MDQQNPALPPGVSMLRRRDVQTRTGLSRSTIYRRVAEGTFPKPVNLGGRTVGWIAAEIQDWLERQIAASRVAPPAIAALSVK